MASMRAFSAMRSGAFTSVIGSYVRLGRTGAVHRRSTRTWGVVLCERSEYVGPLKRRPQRFVRDVRVDFRRRNARMTQEPLHKSNINACFDQECRRSVPEHMRRNSPGETDIVRIAPQLRSNR